MSSVAISPSCCAASRTSAAKRRRRERRANGVIDAHGPDSSACRAAATAASTSARLAQAIVAIVLPVDGSSTGSARSDRASAHAPSM